MYVTLSSIRNDYRQTNAVIIIIVVVIVVVVVDVVSVREQNLTY